MELDEIKFDKLKENRETYFVEYQPPFPSYPFAILRLVFPVMLSKEQIVELMELEADKWLKRYPITVMVSAFDDIGSLINLEPIRNCNHLFGFIGNSGEECRIWRLVPSTELPGSALNTEYLKNVYKDILYETGDQLRHEAVKRARQIRTGWFIVFVWVGIIPALIILLDFTGHWRWLSVMVFTFSLSQALIKALKLSGKWKPSKREIARQEEERQMRFHHYHCKQNPAGFQKLMSENFEREQKEAIHKEAEELKGNNQIPPVQSSDI